MHEKFEETVWRQFRENGYWAILKMRYFELVFTKVLSFLETLSDNF